MKYMRVITALFMLTLCAHAQTATITVTKDQPPAAVAPVASAADVAALQAQVKALEAQVAALRTEMSTLRITSVGVPAAPYEAAAVSLIRLAQTVIDSQPQEVRTELWKMYLEDMRRWQAFWAALRGGLGTAFTESAK